MPRKMLDVLIKQHQYWRFVLRKENVEHNAALKLLAAATGDGKVEDFATAGMKDRVAVTVSHACCVLE